MARIAQKDSLVAPNSTELCSKEMQDTAYTVGSLSPEKYRTAELLWVGKAQGGAFAKETAYLRKSSGYELESTAASDASI